MRKLVAIGSAKGSPGATTLALSVAGHWPVTEPQVAPLLVEADPAGGDVAARFGLSDTPGLMALATSVRRSRAPEVLEGCVQLLPGGLPVVTGPAGAQQATAALELFTGCGGVRVLRGDAQTAGMALLDCGRLEESAVPLVRAADVLLMVTRGEVEALAHVAARAADFRALGVGVELVVVGPSPYPSAEIGAAFGIQRVHTVPWDPRGAAAVCGRATLSDRRWRAAPLARAASHLAWHLAALTDTGPGTLGRDLAQVTRLERTAAGTVGTADAEAQPVLNTGESA